jgi:hypothetical protein
MAVDDVHLGLWFLVFGLLYFDTRDLASWVDRLNPPTSEKEFKEPNTKYQVQSSKYKVLSSKTEDQSPKTKAQDSSR